jgi:hypothetical protein
LIKLLFAVAEKFWNNFGGHKIWGKIPISRFPMGKSFITLSTGLIDVSIISMHVQMNLNVRQSVSASHKPILQHPAGSAFKSPNNKFENRGL